MQLYELSMNRTQTWIQDLNLIIQVSRVVCSFSVVNKMLIMSISYTVWLSIGINVEFRITIVGHWSQSVSITGILLSLARMLELKRRRKTTIKNKTNKNKNTTTKKHQKTNKTPQQKQNKTKPLPHSFTKKTNIS